jgi:hypothetical protein
MTTVVTHVSRRDIIPGAMGCATCSRGTPERAGVPRARRQALSLMLEFASRDQQQVDRFVVVEVTRP